jgi:glycosyltransferase involved in cell wall biosynthesis
MTDILVCLHDFARGGTERIAIGLARDWTDAGRSVVILCGSEAGGLRETVDARVKVIALDPPVARSPLSRFRLGKAMAAHVVALKPEVIFLPGNFHLPLAPPLHAAAPQAKIVMKVSNPPLPGGIADIAVAPLFRHFARSVDGFGVLSEAFARETQRLAPGKAVKVLHDPIYLHGTGGAPAARRAGVCNILWAGRLEPQKDVGLALDTIATLDAPAHLNILGDGALRGWTEAQVKKSGLSDRVTLRGAVPAIDTYLASADLLLLTSRYEGQPAVVGEALARGVPVVATDCTSTLHDMIAIPEAGRVVPSRDPHVLALAVAEVCATPRAPEKLKALVSHYAPEPCAQAWLDWLVTL